MRRKREGRKGSLHEASFVKREEDVKGARGVKGVKGVKGFCRRRWG